MKLNSFNNDSTLVTWVSVCIRSAAHYVSNSVMRCKFTSIVRTQRRLASDLPCWQVFIRNTDFEITGIKIIHVTDLERS